MGHIEQRDQQFSFTTAPTTETRQGILRSARGYRTKLKRQNGYLQLAGGSAQTEVVKLRIRRVGALTGKVVFAEGVALIEIGTVTTQMMSAPHASLINEYEHEEMQEDIFANSPDVGWEVTLQAQTSQITVDGELSIEFEDEWTRGRGDDDVQQVPFVAVIC